MQHEDSLRIVLQILRIGKCESRFFVALLLRMTACLVSLHKRITWA